MSKNKTKYYAVACGRKPGVYNKWYGEDGAEVQVDGFPNARYQGFSTRREAKAWLREFQLPEMVIQVESPTPKSTQTTASNTKVTEKKVKDKKSKEKKGGYLY